MNQNKQSNLEVLLMRPKEQHDELLSNLSRFFKNQSSIRKAYFAVAQFSDSLDSMDYLIAIDVKANTASKIKETTKYLDKINIDTGGRKVAVVDVNDAPYNSYFAKVSPFYKR